MTCRTSATVPMNHIGLRFVSKRNERRKRTPTAIGVRMK